MKTPRLPPKMENAHIEATTRSYKFLGALISSLEKHVLLYPIKDIRIYLFPLIIKTMDFIFYTFRRVESKGKLTLIEL